MGTSIFSSRTRWVMLTIVLLVVALFTPREASGQTIDTSKSWSTAAINAAAHVLGDTGKHRDAGEQITAVIDHIASKLEVPAKELFRVLTRQGLVEGISYIPWAILWSWMIWFYWVKAKKVFLDEHGDFSSEESRLLFIFIGGVLSLIFGMAAANCIDNAIKYALNPEYYPIKIIFDTLRGSSVR
jgi:hypothetical protein